MAAVAGGGADGLSLIAVDSVTGTCVYCQARIVEGKVEVVEVIVRGAVLCYGCEP